MLTWASPWAFLLLIPLVALGVWLVIRERRARPALTFSSLGFVKVTGSSLRAKLRWVPAALYFAAVTCAIVALARPQRADTKVKKNVEGIDIMMVLDVSESMVIEDMKPNRMEACKDVIEKFIQKRVSDRIGFIIFSGESYTRVPLTMDYPMLIQNVRETVIPKGNIKDGTAIGVGIANAVARLKDSTAKSRVMIFLTDGENNTGTIDPETALEIAKGYGIKIYTIGAGKDGESMLPIETIDIFGRKRKTYQPIHSSVNETLLQKMASDTGGKFYRAENTETLRKVFSDIDRLEKTKIDVNQYTKYAELFVPWLEWAVSLTILALVCAQTIFRRVP